MTIDEIEELVGLTEKEFDRNFLKTQKNGLLLTDNQVSTLERFNIDASKCNSMTELLYMIDSTLDGYDEEDEELAYLAETLAERNYYENTRK